jgi:CubicO group peptidase (beta-lactamase class C family)
MTAVYPEPNAWEERAPAALGLDVAALREAARYAEASEVPWPRDIGRVLAAVEKPPYDRLLGPTKERGGPSGLVVRHGYVATRWGQPERVDMTFSTTKSYLATLAGLAWDHGLIPDLDAPVRETVHDGGFDSPQNARITWQHLLQQTSEWEGSLFGIPDTVDHNRSVGAESAATKGERRALRPPGEFWEYNDVRVNRTALALLRLFGEPLPEVLKREVMDPIGASDTWHWHGYRNSWVTVNGRRMQSVPGGAHWGGGLWISSLDHARFGYLLLRRGTWRERKILSEAWLARMTAPCARSAVYGYMFWGAGGNVVLVEPERDLVVVTRWCADVAGVVERVIGAIR